MTSYFHPTTNTFHPASSVSGLDTLLRGSTDTAEPNTRDEVSSPTSSPAGPPKGRSAGIIAAVVAAAIAVGFVVATNDPNPDVVESPVELSVAEPGQSSQAQVQQSIDQALAEARNTEATPRLIDSSIVAIEARQAEATDRARAAQNTPRVNGSPALVQQSIDQALAEARNAQATPDTPHPNDKASIDAIAARNAQVFVNAGASQPTPRLIDSSIVAIEARQAEATDRARAAQNTPRVNGSPALVQQSIDQALAEARNAQATPDTPHPNDKASIDAIAARNAEAAEATPGQGSSSALVPASAI